MTKLTTDMTKLNKILAQLEVAKEQVEILKGQAKELLEDTELEGTIQLDGLAIAIIEDSYSLIFNSKAFQKDHADLYNKYKTQERFIARHFKVVAKDIDRCYEIATED